MGAMSRGTKVERPVESVAQGRYVLERVLGSGGMATVYRAHDSRLDLARAVKILNPELVSSASLRKRFEMEARTMAKLHHNNIVSVYDIGVENEFAFMVMELLEGGSLNDRLKNVGYMLPRSALAAVQSILSALVMAHGKGVIHRDIKPHNVLVTMEGQPKLTDFGIAHLIGQDKALTASNAVIGTWAFMAPEQRKSARRVNVQSDIYSVGATLYALLTARDPFDIYNKELQKEMFTGIPEPLVDIIERATRYWPEERYATAAEMLSAVQRVDAALRPEYVDEPSRIAPLVNMGEVSPQRATPAPRTDPMGLGSTPRTDSTFDDEDLDRPSNQPTPTLAPEGEIQPRMPSNPHPTLAAVTRGDDPDDMDEEEPTDPFVDEATPIHIWREMQEVGASRPRGPQPGRATDPGAGLMAPVAPPRPVEPVGGAASADALPVPTGPSGPTARPGPVQAVKPAPVVARGPLVRVAAATFALTLVIMALGWWVLGPSSTEVKPTEHAAAGTTGSKEQPAAPTTPQAQTTSVEANPTKPAPAPAGEPAKPPPSATTTAPATSATPAPVKEPPPLEPLKPVEPKIRRPEDARRRLEALPGQ